MAETEQDTTERDPVMVLLDGVREFARTRDEQAGREVLLAMVKQYLAELSAAELDALLEEVREPAETAYPESWRQPKARD
ncbi:hypothetical protein [Mycolicibacterium elephantis]|uniref:Uncharacterized protein n=1 Tax=Mycolicibacterium elephantis DSM 44368 TaxID=1335622 RepID=A0A439DPP5_9MYCO|nr:hypothetical protein [Mycolicibacterium elephantis]MCV7219843.1 hypothetical protein [Mycolicibacterium elephantis]RWA17583.1 hypothetical protein MELE44368_05400 [Mycolicibacterium elephantis DSM 44368]